MTQQHDYPANAWTYWSSDAEGNCTQINAPNGSTYFSYNGLDLMTSVLFRTGVANYFWYDAKQRRYAIQESTGTTYFTYDTDGLCELLERNSAGSIVAEYTRGYAPVKGIGDRTGAKLITAQGTYYQYDASGLTGNILRMTNAQGLVTGSFEYNAWGRLLRYEPPVEGTRYGFSSPAWMLLKDDPDRQHWITRTRTYDAWTGRFVQKEPKATKRTPVSASMSCLSVTDSSEATCTALNKASIFNDFAGAGQELENPYLAHLANPLVFIDPEGRQGFVGWLVIGAMVVGGIIILGITLSRRKTNKGAAGMRDIKCSVQDLRGEERRFTVAQKALEDARPEVEAGRMCTIQQLLKWLRVHHNVGPVGSNEILWGGASGQASSVLPEGERNIITYLENDEVFNSGSRINQLMDPSQFHGDTGKMTIDFVDQEISRCGTAASWCGKEAARRESKEQQ